MMVDDPGAMSPAVLAVVLSVLSAVGYAVAAVTQSRVAAHPRRGSVLTAPLWWLSVAFNAAAAVLHVVALRYGPLAVVQPLGALTLVFALPIGSWVGGRRVTGREWRGAATTLGGLGLLLLVVDTSAPATGLDSRAVPALAALTALTLALLLRGGDTGAFRGPRLAAAGGIAFAVASVLSQTVVLRLGDPTANHVGTAVIAAVVAGLSVAGMMLAQSAYRFGLGAQLATVTIANPVFAAAVGVLVLGQSISAVAAAVAVPAGLLAAGGVVLLATPGGSARGAGASTPVTDGDHAPAVRRLVVAR